ncbi:OTUD5 family protein [Megaselia abdita]
MTIKPQKNSDKNKDSGSVEQPQTQNTSRNHGHRSVIDGQSPQRFNDSFDHDLTARHRRSPHKSSHRSKREKREREKVSVGGSNTPPHAHVYHPILTKCASPRPNSVPPVDNVPPPPNPSVQSSPANHPSNLDIISSIEETLSGYNSGDEHLTPKEKVISADEWKTKDEQFAKTLSERGFILKQTEEDGACLFRAISHQIYGDEEMHDVIRQQAMDYIHQNREYFSQFVTEDINSYIKRKRKSNAHGNHIEIQAISEIYNRSVEVYCYNAAPVNIFNKEQMENGYPPLRLSYQHGTHYNAILDPYNATVGVGLGLAGYKPEMQTQKALQLSEDLELEQTMLEDKIKTTDWEATNEAIEEQIARESYIQWCRDNLKTCTNSNPNSGVASGSATASSSSSATVTSAEINKGNKSCTVTATSSTATTSSSASASGSSSSAGCSDFSGASNLHLLSSKGCNSPRECDSDDTDMSSTSSIDHQMGEKRNGVKKSKSRKFGKRRKQFDLKQTTEKEPQIEISEGDIGPPSAKSPKCDASPTLEQTELSKAESSPSKELPSKAVRINAPCTSKQAETLHDLPVSTFYQSLLESSYADDGKLLYTGFIQRFF